MNETQKDYQAAMILADAINGAKKRTAGLVGTDIYQAAYEAALYKAKTHAEREALRTRLAGEANEAHSALEAEELKLSIKAIELKRAEERKFRWPFGESLSAAHSRIAKWKESSLAEYKKKYDDCCEKERAARESLERVEEEAAKIYEKVLARTRKGNA